MRGHSTTFAICTLACLSGLGGCRPGVGGLDFAMVLEDAKGLDPGDAVAYKGMRIGLVRTVELSPEGDVQVRVRIDRRFRETVWVLAKKDGTWQYQAIFQRPIGD